MSKYKNYFKSVFSNFSNISKIISREIQEKIYFEFLEKFSRRTQSTQHPQGGNVEHLTFFQRTSQRARVNFKVCLLTFVYIGFRFGFKIDVPNSARLSACPSTTMANQSVMIPMAVIELPDLQDVKMTSWTMEILTWITSKRRKTETEMAEESRFQLLIHNKCRSITTVHWIKWPKQDIALMVRGFARAFRTSESAD
jgi:hypothetical protein